MNDDRVRMSELGDMVRRGEEAKALMGNQLLSESLKMLREAYVRQAAACDAKDDLGRFRLLEGMKMVDTHEALLRGVMESGKVAQEELDALVAARGIKRIIPKF